MFDFFYQSWVQTIILLVNDDKCAFNFLRDFWAHSGGQVTFGFQYSAVVFHLL
ncbi:hypothetical protein VIBNISOn1_p0169 [Vibrio nigripulchritudo SOn1]|uniref:Uncharacterized protein n=1 Tax=Vibrio nigripulchritudo SOn1 TaxID=1238450 RepID=A0AAV2W1K4_9VIBR|nr:hypothetical protein VIBNISOn1_p0169 [Vibrio nigripulchritudo SOn1]